MEGQAGPAGVSITTLACVATTSAVLAVLGSYALLSRWHQAALPGGGHPSTPNKRYSSPAMHKKRKHGPQLVAAGGAAGETTACGSRNGTQPTPELAWLQAIAAPPRRDPCDPAPREGYLEWDDYFMALAFLSAQRSKDPNKQVGAVIVGPNKVILAIGYNGFPRGCSDGALPWAKMPPLGSTDQLLTKYPYVVHAEANALLNKNTASLSGASVYVTMFPCNECAKLLIQAGIKEVVYHEAKVEDKVAGEGCSVTGADTTCCAQHKQHVSPPLAGDASPCSDQQDPVMISEGGLSVNSYSVSDACYVASLTLLRMAGVLLRQHKLERTLVLGPPMVS